jgi:Spy/CpxP family protein refolding chaperone
MKRFHALPMALAMLALVVSVGLATSALARPPDHGPDHLARFAEHLNRRFELLDLSDSQRSTMQTLLRAHTKEGIRLKAEIDTMHVDLRQLLHTDPVELTRVKQALQAIAAKKVDLRLAHITVMQDIRQVLTPEQQKKFQTMSDHHPARDEGERR